MQYKNNTSTFRVTFDLSFIGMSPYTMGLTAHSSWKFRVPAGFGIHHAMNPDPYKGIFGGKNCRDSPVQTQRNCESGFPGNSTTRIAIFFYVQCTKMGENKPNHQMVIKILQMVIKYTKWQENIPNGNKIYQMAVKYSKWQ
jgi:4-aminobutyrate aminotransferase-like enzyme